MAAVVEMFDAKLRIKDRRVRCPVFVTLRCLDKGYVEIRLKALKYLDVFISEDIHIENDYLETSSPSDNPDSHELSLWIANYNCRLALTGHLPDLKYIRNFLRKPLGKSGACVEKLLNYSRGKRGYGSASRSVQGSGYTPTCKRTDQEKTPLAHGLNKENVPIGNEGENLHDQGSPPSAKNPVRKLYCSPSSSSRQHRVDAKVNAPVTTTNGTSELQSSTATAWAEILVKKPPDSLTVSKIFSKNSKGVSKRKSPRQPKSTSRSSEYYTVEKLQPHHQPNQASEKPQRRLAASEGFMGLSSTNTCNKVAGVRAEEHIVLVAEQQKVIDACLQGRNVFCTGGAGTGKTTLLKRLIGALKHKYGEKHVFVTATTGLAACAIGGVTLHQFAGISGAFSDSCDGADIFSPAARELIDRTIQQVILRPYSTDDHI